MIPRPLTSTAIAALLAITAWEVRAGAECEPARPASSAPSLPAPWRDAVDELSRSTGEPGHPWSCSGGTITITIAPHGGVTLRVERAGEPPITKPVASPEDVVPLGQALFAAPLLPPPPSAEPHVEPVPANDVGPDRRPTPPAERKEPRLLLGGGVDARGVGGSGVAWIGPSLGAAVPLGHWLPSLSVRQQSALADGPPIDEVSFALALQYRIPIQSLELRAGLALRGGVVFRDLPRPQGEQTQLQGRVGPVVSLVVPVISWANIVIAVDADAVALSRETTAPPSTTAQTAKPFPTFTIGGTVGIEVPL